jgi:hypothetical protein
MKNHLIVAAAAACGVLLLFSFATSIGTLPFNSIKLINELGRKRKLPITIVIAFAKAGGQSLTDSRRKRE